jgi:hypothetical protein
MVYTEKQKFRYMPSSLHRCIATFMANISRNSRGRKFGEFQKVTVYVSQENGAAPSAALILHATSESDPSKTATSTVSYRAMLSTSIFFYLLTYPYLLI